MKSLCMSVKVLELFAFREKEKKEKCKEERQVCFMGLHCKSKLLSSQNEYISKGYWIEQA